MSDSGSSTLKPERVQLRLGELEGWSLSEDELSISKTYTLESFLPALDFVRKVGELAEAADHHPDIDIRYRKVTLVLSTHSAGGLTDKDFDLAAKIDG